MKIFLNGEEVDCGDAETIAQLLQQNRLPPETTLVEQNGVALRRRDWPHETLQPNDRIEILRVAAGG